MPELRSFADVLTNLGNALKRAKQRRDDDRRATRSRFLQTLAFACQGVGAGGAETWFRVLRCDEFTQEASAA